MPRRAVLRSAAGAAAALLVACGTANAPTPTPAIMATPTPPAATVAPTPQPTPQPTPPTSDFLRMLAVVPMPFDRWQRTLTYANRAAIAQLYGYTDIHIAPDLMARNISTTDYGNAFGSCFLSPFTYNGLSIEGEEYRIFGFDTVQIAHEIGVGALPDFLTTKVDRSPLVAFGSMEGAFDAAMIAAALQAGMYTYTPAMHDGVPYFSIRADNEFDLHDQRSQFFVERRDRLAVRTDRIITAPATAIMEAAIDAETRRIPALDADPTMRALAAALGDVTSVVVVPPDYPDRAIEAQLSRSRSRTGEAQSLARGIRSATSGWAVTHSPEVVAVAVTDTGDWRRTLHLALVYANPADAIADAPELTQRLTTLRVGAPVLPAFPNIVASHTATSNRRGVYVADLAIVQKPSLNSAWLHDAAATLLFLLPLTDPNRTADRVAAIGATATPAASPTP